MDGSQGEVHGFNAGHGRKEGIHNVRRCSYQFGVQWDTLRSCYEFFDAGGSCLGKVVQWLVLVRSMNMRPERRRAQCDLPPVVAHMRDDNPPGVEGDSYFAKPEDAGEQLRG